MAVSVVFFVAVIISTLGSFGNALQCHQCQNIEVSNDLLNVKTKTNPGCKSATSTSAVRCPDDTVYACVYLEAEGTVKQPFIGLTTVKVQARGCSPKLGQSNGCTSGDQSGTSFVKTLFNMADIDIDGKYCECNTDMCVAGCSGIYVGDTCLAWWIVGASGGGALLLLILLCTCCCCCCGCCGCCKKDRPGVVLAPVGYPNTCGHQYLCTPPVADRGQQYKSAAFDWQNNHSRY